MIFKSISRTDSYGYLLLILVFILGIYFANTNLEYFDNVYTKEDGTIEYSTAFMLLCVSILLFSRFIKLFQDKKGLWKVGVFLLGLIFLFGAGEEISWGQRIFDIESSEYFKANNAQQETNLHNLVVDGKKMNKIIFSQLLTAVLIIYLIVLPILYRKFKVVKKLADMFAVPIAKWHHTIAFLVATAILTLIPSSRKWELYELAFGVIFFLIILNPFNNMIYKKSEN